MWWNYMGLFPYGFPIHTVNVRGIHRWWTWYYSHVIVPSTLWMSGIFTVELNGIIPIWFPIPTVNVWDIHRWCGGIKCNYSHIIVPSTLWMSQTFTTVCAKYLPIIMLKYHCITGECLGHSQQWWGKYIDSNHTKFHCTTGECLGHSQHWCGY